MIVVGITGTFRAGKDSVVQWLRKKGFAHHSVSAFVIEEVARRGLPVNRDSMRDVAIDLRTKRGPTYLIDALCDRARLAGQSYVIIESLRTPLEVLRIKKLEKHDCGWVIGIDAHREERYRRAVAAGTPKDIGVTFDMFVKQECLESIGKLPYEQNIPKALELAHITLHNNGTLEEFVALIEREMAPIVEKLMKARA